MYEGTMTEVEQCQECVKQIFDAAGGKHECELCIWIKKEPDQPIRSTYSASVGSILGERLYGHGDTPANATDELLAKMKETNYPQTPRLVNLMKEADALGFTLKPKYSQEPEPTPP